MTSWRSAAFSRIFCIIKWTVISVARYTFLKSRTAPVRRYSVAMVTAISGYCCLILLIF